MLEGSHGESDRGRCRRCPLCSELGRETPHIVGTVEPGALIELLATATSFVADVRRSLVAHDLLRQLLG